MAARITVNLGRTKGKEGRKERQGGRGSRRLTNGGATVVREGRGTFALFLGLQIVYETCQSQHQQRRTPKNTPRRDSQSIIHMSNNRQRWLVPPGRFLRVLFLLLSPPPPLVYFHYSSFSPFSVSLPPPSFLLPAHSGLSSAARPTGRPQQRAPLTKR